MNPVVMNEKENPHSIFNEKNKHGTIKGRQHIEYGQDIRLKLDDILFVLYKLIEQ